MTTTHTLPQGTMAAALSAVGLHDSHVAADTAAPQHAVQSTFAFFDPIDLVEGIQHLTLRSLILSSMAWSADTLLINKARDVFYAARKTYLESETPTINDFNEFVNAVKELEANQQYAEELGFEQNAGALQAIAQLTGLRQHWHDRAEIAAVAAKTKYAPKTLSELIATERIRTVDGEVAINMEALAEFSARGKVERIPQIKQHLIAEQNARYAAQHKDRQLVAPAVLNIISMGEYRQAGDSHDFWQLSVDDQVRLITQAKGATERSIMTLATWRLPQGDYARFVLPEGYDTVDKFDEVLNSTKFAR